jgi:hypothetical protein
LCRRGHRTKKTLEIDPIQAETVRLIFQPASEGNGSSGPMGVKSIAKHLNEAGIRTRDGGRWGVDAVHKVLAQTTYIGRHRFNTKHWKTRERKPEAEVVEMAVPPIIEAAEFEAVQTLLKTRSPAMTAPRVVSGPIEAGRTSNIPSTKGLPPSPPADASASIGRRSISARCSPARPLESNKPTSGFGPSA